MKQFVLLMSLFISVAFVSCKKQYSCSCTSDTTVEVRFETIKADNYGIAEEQCKSYEKEYIDRQFAAEVTCRLK